MLPDGLKDRDKWVCWKYKNRDGKKAKVPVSPHDPHSGPISFKDPLHWANYETAQQAVPTTDDIEGLGWVLTTDGPIVGIDLDDCRLPATGTIQDWAVEIVEKVGSYTEISPSGTGLHILLKADGGLPGDENRTGDIEMYEGQRFLTVTGDHLSGSETSIREAQTELNEIYREYLAEDTEPSQTGNSERSENTNDGQTPLEDRELVEKAKGASNGRAFEKLWQGIYSHKDSHSEARLALYNFLAFWTGKDKRQMWRLFQQSGLYPHPDEKGKCDRLKDKEIQKAIRDTRNTYSGTFDTEKLPTDTKEIASDGGRLTVSDPTVVGVIEALENIGQGSTAEIADHPKVDRSERQVRRALDYLNEHGAIEWVRDGRSTLCVLTD